MTGIEVLAGMAAAYVVRKLRRIGRGVDQEVDHVLDAGLDSLHRAVSDVLGDDRALALLEREAAEGRATERTVRRLTDAIAEAADSDADFAERLDELVERIRQVEQTEGAGEGSDGPLIAVRQEARASGRATINQAGRDQSHFGEAPR